jgi:bacterioferritin-associated ferredoxin
MNNRDIGAREKIQFWMLFSYNGLKMTAGCGQDCNAMKNLAQKILRRKRRSAQK